MTDELYIAGRHLTELPNDISKRLYTLNCCSNNIITFADKLPRSLRNLFCDCNQLTKLPDQLPHNLHMLLCSYNRLMTLPDKLPNDLYYITCSYNKLTTLPDKLPQHLKEFDCSNNKLTTLPNRIPPSLKRLWCDNNNISVLPDLPNTILHISLYNNPLEDNYPRIFTFDKTKDVIKYVNLYNAIRRKKEWLAKVNADNILLELYMQRVMHPSRLADLKADPNIDVEEYMTRYVDSL